MSTIRLTIHVPTDKTLAIYSALREHGVTIEGVSTEDLSIENTPESEAVDSDPTPPHGTPRDGGWVITDERYQQLTEAKTHRDQLLGEVVKLRRRVEEMRVSNSQIRRECGDLRRLSEELRGRNSDIRRERDELRDRVEEMRERVTQLTVAETHRNQLLSEVATLRGRVEQLRKQAVDGPRRLWRLGQFHSSVTAAYTWLQREYGPTESVPAALDAASSFIDTVREAIDKYEGES